MIDRHADSPVGVHSPRFPGSPKVTQFLKQKSQHRLDHFIFLICLIFEFYKGIKMKSCLFCHIIIALIENI